MCECEGAIGYVCMYHARERGIEWKSRSECLENHTHQWGEPYLSHFGGNYVRACVISGCRMVDVYFEEEDLDNED